jgi:hypothetical protein
MQTPAHFLESFGIPFLPHGFFQWGLNLCQLHEAQDSPCTFAAIHVGERDFKNMFAQNKLLDLINWTKILVQYWIGQPTSGTRQG